MNIWNNCDKHKFKIVIYKDGVPFVSVKCDDIVLESETTYATTTKRSQNGTLQTVSVGRADNPPKIKFEGTATDFDFTISIKKNEYMEEG